MTDLTKLTIQEAYDGLRKKDFSALDLTKSFLSKINEKDKEINAFLLVCEKQALEQAQKVGENILDNKSFLAGIPFVVKDNILVKGLKCSAGSRMLENYTASYDATVIEKLKAQGAVLLGKTNMDEFAMGSSTENSAFFQTKNPHDTTRVPGGSSGGSAASVASDFCLFALGSDTGGSVRQPASFCGVVGFKPTYGAVSRYGLIAMASSLDQIGPFTKNTKDCQTVFGAIKGWDKKDSTSSNKDFAKAKEKIRVGIPKEYFGEGLDKNIAQIIDNLIGQLEKQNIEIKQISLPHTKYALAVYHIIMDSEVSANLARYDGLRYGFRTQGLDLLDDYLKNRRQGLGAEVKRRIILGTFALSAGYHDAYYKKSQKVRNLISQDFKKAFEEVDLILTPTSPTVAFKRGEKSNDPLAMYFADIFTTTANLAGLPAISLPVGKVDGLPAGVQLIGNYFQEETIFSLSFLIEKLCQN